MSHIEEFRLSQKKSQVNEAKLFSHLVKKISQGFFFVDKNGEVIFFNEEAEKIFEKPSKDVLGKNFWELFSDNLLGFSFRELLFWGKAPSLQFLTLTPSSKEKKELKITPFFEEEGAGILIEEITLLRKMQLLLNRDEKLKELGEMAAIIAHDFRNGLGGIRGFSSLLFRNLEKWPHLQEMVTSIIEGTKSLERRISNILQFSRPIKPEIASTNLNLLLQETSEFVKMDPSFPQKVLLELSLPQEELWIAGDKELLKAALLNLLFNALQAIEESGKVSLSLFKNSHSATITIADTGKGIDPEDFPKLFSPFFTTKQKGNGIGLYETKKILQAHFGYIEVVSKKDEGAIFSLHLPLQKPKEPLSSFVPFSSLSPSSYETPSLKEKEND